MSNQGTEGTAPASQEDSSFRVLICGSREWRDELPMKAWFAAFENKPVTIIHGCAKGADSLAGFLAECYRLKVEEYPADWSMHGKAAGPIRNQRMLDEGKPNLVVAFKDGIDRGLNRGGTEHMVKIAKAAGIPTYVVSHG